MSWSHTRRRFLQGLGLGAGSLLLPSLACDRNERGPQRLLVVFTLHGTVYDSWKMHPAGAALDQRWSSPLANLDADAFSPILRPLHPWRERMSVYDGLALVSAELERNNVRHIIGSIHAMTGANTAIVSSTAIGSAPSIDQRIADLIARPEQFRSLELAVGEPLVEISTRAERQVLPLQTSPLLLHQQLFGSGDAELAASAQADLFKTTGAWYEDFARELPQADKQRVELHRDLLHDLELRAKDLANQSCRQPVDLPATWATGLSSYSDTFDDFSRLVTAAFSCDLTRVATLYLSTQPTDRVGPGLSGEIHEEYAHKTLTEELPAQVMTSYHRGHAEDLASLLSALDAIPEGEGSVLDNTTVVWCNELGDGNHGYERWPVVVVGGRGLRQGNYEYWPSDTPFAGYLWDGSRSSSMGVPNEKFLTTLARSFGATTKSMPIEEVIGIEGAKIDCTGVLDGVLS